MIKIKVVPQSTGQEFYKLKNAVTQLTKDIKTLEAGFNKATEDIIEVKTRLISVERSKV